MTIRPHARHLAPLLALLLLSPAIAHARVAHPALWKVSSPTATLYFFGTIHALPKGVEWHTPALKKAETEAQTLVLEIGDVDDKAKTTQAFQSLAVAPNLPEVTERLPAPKRVEVAKMLSDAGLPAGVTKSFKTWAVALILAPAIFKQLDVDPANGVEPALKDDFLGAHKTVEGLETAAFQFGVFNALSTKAQNDLLISEAEDMATAKQDFDVSLKAWAAGDPAAIAANFDKDLKEQPELARVLLHNRNANWANWVVARLKGKGTTLIAVGAGHLAGSDSLLAMLRARGIKVQRVG